MALKMAETVVNMMITVDDLAGKLSMSPRMLLYYDHAGRVSPPLEYDRLARRYYASSDAFIVQVKRKGGPGRPKGKKRGQKKGKKAGKRGYPRAEK